MARKIKKSLECLFSSSNPMFREMISHVYELESLNQALWQYLDPSLKEHCHVANLRNYTLYIQADSPAFATMIRFALPDLLASLKKHPGLSGLQAIELSIISPKTEAPKPKAKPISPLSDESAQCLSETAKTIENKGLKNILMKLARR